MSETLNVVTLLGSLRKGSFNGMVARTLPKIAPAGMEVSALPSIGDIPLYDADLQQEEGFPASVEALAEQIRKADGVVIVTPEYNYSVPGRSAIIRQTGADPDQLHGCHWRRALPVPSASNPGVPRRHGNEQAGIYGRDHSKQGGSADGRSD